MTVALEKPPNGQVAFRLGLGDETCRLALWFAAAGLPTAPIEACLTRADTDEPAFNSWLNSRHSPDPTLVVPLVEDPQKPGRLVNRDTIRGRLFVRDCRGKAVRYRKHADISIDAGSLEVSVQPNQSGALDVLFRATGATLDQTDEGTWKDVVRGCGNAYAMLPDKPAAGISSLLAGRTAGVTPLGDPIHQALGDLRRRLEDLNGDGVLKFQEAIRLVRSIDSADQRRREGDSGSAIQAIDQLAKQTESLGRTGGLSPEETGILLDGARLVRARIFDSVFADVGVQRAPKCEFTQPGLCVPMSLHVDAATRVPVAEQDGTAARPFLSIAAALDAAAAGRACNVTVHVARGTYPGSLVITRDTFIIGEVASGRRLVVIRGSVASDGAHDVTMENVAIVDSPAAGIRVWNACAYTVLRNVSVESALDYGIDINGGALAANDISVRSTRGTVTVVSSGVGIRLRGGAQAAMARVELTDNDGQGLTVIGAGTKAFARAVTATHNRTVIGFAGLLATVSALDDGLLLMETSVIEDNDSIGLLVSVRGRIHFRAGRVTGTRVLGPPAPGFGINAAAHILGILELSTFTLSNAGLAGAQYASDSLGKFTDGEVRGQPIGVNVQETLLELGCIGLTVRYHDNEINLDSSRLPVPGTDDGPPPEPHCETVPFICGWCAD